MSRFKREKKEGIGKRILKTALKTTLPIGAGVLGGYAGLSTGDMIGRQAYKSLSK